MDFEKRSLICAIQAAVCSGACWRTLTPTKNKRYLSHYRLSLGRNGLPVELHRTPVGTTYRAQEIGTGREVALELVPCAVHDAASRQRFEAEAVAAKQINHINIPTLYDFEIEDGQLVYVTEYFEEGRIQRENLESIREPHA
jgi:hypothetical protein